MPMTKIIYLDIDGTLRDERLGIPESARSSPGDMQGAGNPHCYLYRQKSRGVYSGM